MAAVWNSPRYDFLGAQQATDEGQKQRPGFPAGAQQAAPAIDRESIEAALEYYSRYHDGPHSEVLIEAARAHLETLPKPEPARWHVTASVHGPKGTTALPPYVTEDRETAVRLASNYLKQGYTNVNIRWVRS